VANVCFGVYVDFIMSEPNPCLTCGSCCAYFRVSFYWGESNEAPEGFVPRELTEQVHQHLLCMKGTNNYPPRCAARRGRQGSFLRHL
jgi:uncharacterized protein